MNKVIIFSAPSGSGKTTIIKYLSQLFKQLEFSVSATSRSPRGKEVNGVDYHFLSVGEFKQKIADNEFIEWEEVYTDNFYGTLKSEVERIWAKENIILFDVDVKGGLNLKSKFPNSLSVFVMPPSISHLRDRLEKRGTDSAETIAKRIKKAEDEINHSKDFDVIVLNDKLEDALKETERVVETYLKK